MAPGMRCELTDAIAERVGFADIDNVTSGVFEEVDAGKFGELRGLGFGIHERSIDNF
jgi:hypothetical protein